MNNIYDDLSARGLIKQMTHEELKERLKKPITLYIGFDPTANNLHVGHLMQIITLKRFEKYGHQPIALIGGATGLIGDPSFKKEERKLNSFETVQEYVNSIEKQIKKFFDNPIIVNNYSWTKEMSAIEFLREYGKLFTVNNMIAKESVASRMETGISFTEFSYPILQGMDFYQLYTKYDCQLQVGGSDQWGNIVAGTEIIKRKNQEKSEQAYGLTLPLITKSDGTKFGKTEGGAIWLNPDETSPYEFYQFFYNTNDSDIIKYLKYLTLLSIEEINQLEEETKINPKARKAQKALAEQMTIFVHGEEALKQVEKISEALFTGDISQLTQEQIEKEFTHIEKFTIKEGNILEALIGLNLAQSKREGREFINAKAIKLNGTIVEDENLEIKKSEAIAQKYILVKRGKKKIALAIID